MITEKTRLFSFKSDTASDAHLGMNTRHRLLSLPMKPCAMKGAHFNIWDARSAQSLFTRTRRIFPDSIAREGVARRHAGRTRTRPDLSTTTSLRLAE